jgi:large subunit ribosomal protein L25
MKSVSISGSSRANVGTKDAKAVRAAGQIPCVLYGGTEQIHFQAEEKVFKPLIYTPEVKLADLTIDGRTFKAAVKEVQYHPINDRILHVDFLQLFPGKPLTIEIPVKITGNSPGVKAGGKLVTKFRKLKVRGMVEDLPEFIEVSIDKLDIGQDIRVKEISVNGLTLLNTPTSVVVGIKTTRNVAAGPENTGKK